MKPPFLRLLPDVIRQRMEASRTLQKAAGNVGWLFFDKLLRLAIGLVVMAWVARYLGPERYGVWNYATAFAALFGSLAALGLDGIVIREVVKNDAARDEILGSAFLLKLCGGVVSFGLSVLLISYLKPHDNLTFLLVVISAAAFVIQSTDVIDLYFQSRVQSRYSIAAKDTSFVLLSGVRVALILSGASVVAFASAGLAEVVLGGLLLAIAYRLVGRRAFRWKPKMHTALGLLRDSWPLILSGLLIMVYMRIDQIMLGEMVGSTAVGIYAAAVRISEVWFFVPVAVAGSAYPAIVALRNADPQRYRRRIQQLCDLLTWVSVAGALLVSLFSTLIIQLLYGDAFSESAAVLVIHVWAGVFVTFGVVSGKFLLAENLTRMAFYRALSGAILNVLANLILIPISGPIGAAIATLLAQAMATYVFDLLNEETRIMFRMKTRSLFLVNLLRMRRREYE